MRQARFSPRPACGERGRGEGHPLLPAGEGLGMSESVSSAQASLQIRRPLAGGSPAASDFLLFGQEKVTKEKATPLRWPPASRSQQPQAGQCGNSLRHNFKGSEARTSALLLTGLSLPSAAASEGERQPAGQPPIPASGDRGQVLNLNSPLCRRGRMTELGAVEASVSEHVAAKQIVRVCEPPNSASRSRLAPPGFFGGAAQRGALFFRPFLLGKQKKGASRRAAPGQTPYEMWKRQQ
jgi:hypothetical protein